MIRVRRLPLVNLALLAAALCVGACNPAAIPIRPPASASGTPAPSISPAPASPVIAAADLTLDRVEARLERARIMVDLVAILLPADLLSRIRQGEEIAAIALRAARAAVTAIDRDAHLRRAAAAVDRIDAATGYPAGG